MKKKLSEDVRDQIEELIAFGKLPPGEHLDETELAERFGVSRTPIREALNQLATAGLVELRARRPSPRQRDARGRKGAQKTKARTALGE